MKFWIKRSKIIENPVIKTCVMTACAGKKRNNDMRTLHIFTSNEVKLTTLLSIVIENHIVYIGYIYISYYSHVLMDTGRHSDAAACLPGSFSVRNCINAATLVEPPCIGSRSTSPWIIGRHLAKCDKIDTGVKFHRRNESHFSQWRTNRDLTFTMPFIISRVATIVFGWFNEHMRRPIWAWQLIVIVQDYVRYSN